MTTHQEGAISAPTSLGLILAAVLSWLPITALVVARFTWTALPSTLTTHWNLFGAADARTTPGAAFWDFAPPAALLALIVTALVATAGGDISRRGGAIGIGVTSWLLGTIAGIWFVLGLLALDPSHAALYVGLLIASGIIFGAATAGAVALPRRYRAASTNPLH